MMGNTVMAPWSKQAVVYCSNVHPGHNYTSIIEQIHQHVLPIKRARQLDRMSLGLWFNEQVITELLADKQKAKAYVELLVEHQLTIMTLNAFPQRSFHHQTSKTQVYRPDWSDPARLSYTHKLLEFMAQYPQVFHPQLSLSTLPLGYANTWSDEKHRIAIEQLEQYAQSAAGLKQASGIHARLCLEMEPDCVLESSQAMIDFLCKDIAIHQHSHKSQHLGVCFDICHQAVMQENISQSLAQFSAENIVIGKIQVSSALSFRWNSDSSNQSDLDNFLESPFLHQVKIKQGDHLIAIPDLNRMVLEDTSLPRNREWLIHFHLPIHKTELEKIQLKTTQKAIIETLAYFQSVPNRPHLEVETYTWGIIDKNNNANELNNSLLKEIHWLENQLNSMNLLAG